jgi:hypothetical protein
MDSSDHKICPNYKSCQLVNAPYIVREATKRDMYMSKYCLHGESAWSRCKRYITDKALNFCPDFVLPDSPGTPEEIISKFDDDLKTNHSTED